MRKLFSSIAFALLALIFTSQNAVGSNTGYKITCKVNGVKDTVCFLGNYYGDKTYLRDTAKVDANGKMVFTGNEKLEGGIYLVILPSKKYFELIVDKEQEFYMETDTSELVMKMKIKNSNDNQLFYEYLRFIQGKQKESEHQKNELKNAKTKADSTAIREKMKKIDQEVKDYKLKYMKNYPQSFLTTVFKASQEPEVPEAPILPNGKPDSTFGYRYFKAHFWDNIDLTDERLLRTPIFHNKLKQYMSTLVVQIPDSINHDADILIEKTRKDKNVFRYVVWYITNTYETSNIMGMDAVFVHMAKKYYLNGDAWWVTPEQLTKIRERVVKIEPILIGKVAPNLILADTAGRYVSLHGVRAKVTIVYFWDPDCGHCQKETPKLLEFYQKNKHKGIEVYAIYTEDHETTWKNYIKSKGLNWINVADLKHESYFKYHYDIYSSPVIYVLDESKKIIAKRIGADQLETFLDHHLNEAAKNKK